MSLIEPKETIVRKIATDITDEYKVRSYGVKSLSSNFSESSTQEALLKLFMIDFGAVCVEENEDYTEVLKMSKPESQMKIIYNIENVSTTIIQGDGYTPIRVVSSDFINPDTYINHSLKGKNFLIFWNDINRYISAANSEWVPLSTGGFKMLTQGFDATGNSYEFIIYPID